MNAPYRHAVKVVQAVHGRGMRWLHVEISSTAHGAGAGGNCDFCGDLSLSLSVMQSH